MADRFWIDPPEEWEESYIDPGCHCLPNVCWILAEDLGHARETYVTFRDGDDELAIAFIRSGVVAGNLEDAREGVVLAGLEGRTPKIFRIVGPSMDQREEGET
ncbi:hypothetical protein [Streptomyces cucumeris]|uniref:hypothetical protein n=1 Tax=Streptomyces cucumeris TaxID=2962890 RepID=UPI0020C895E9|nr:hypothetical protein [Streptomyces sp. NEAU-Y11]MCP9209563.1 hypothetical protein [Streptomyces sp. NEAU-Y11]